MRPLVRSAQMPGAGTREDSFQGGRRRWRCRRRRRGGRGHGSLAVTRPRFPPSPGRGCPKRGPRPGPEMRGRWRRREPPSRGAGRQNSISGSILPSHPVGANVPLPPASRSARAPPGRLSGISMGPAATRLPVPQWASTSPCGHTGAGLRTVTDPLASVYTHDLFDSFSVCCLVPCGLAPGTECVLGTNE